VVLWIAGSPRSIADIEVIDWRDPAAD